MNNYGEQVSSWLKVKVSAAVLLDNPLYPPGTDIEIYHDHEGPWYVTDRMNDLHYLGRAKLAAPTHPNFKAEYTIPRSTKDPTRQQKSLYWKGALKGCFGIAVSRIRRFYIVVNRRVEPPTQGFRYGAHNTGTAKVVNYN